MVKCDNCICNNVCDHNKYGFENCNSFNDKSQKVEMIGKYNTRIRQAISDEFVRCSKERIEVQTEILSINKQLADEKDTMPHSVYCYLKERAAWLEKRLRDLCIELNTWDKAREICLNIADDESAK